MASISIIGPGRHGTAIARLFATHGVDVTLFHYRPEKAKLAAQVLRTAAPTAKLEIAESLEAAADAADVVALTTLWDAPQREVISRIGDRLVGKVILDVSNPLDVTPTGIHLRKPLQGSAGQFVASLLLAGVGHAKAFSNLTTAVLGTAADQAPRAVMPYLADSAASAHRVRALLDRTGWLPRYVGDISQSAKIEIGGAYNKVAGRLGRTVLDEQEFSERFGLEQLPKG
jgi:predicted dinucleotide-binding enzyme